MQKKLIDKHELEEQLNSGKRKADIAEHFGISQPTLRKLARSYGIDFNTKKQHPEVTKEWLEEHWIKTNKSLPMLAEEFNINLSLLEARRVKYKLSKRFKHPIDLERLLGITPENYYIAGLVATDGYVPEGQDAFELSLVGDSEYELLSNIRRFYGNEGIKISKYGKAYRLRVAGEGLNSYLLKYFNIPSGAKTFTVGIPDYFPSEECARAYIRGCFDGDGYIGKDKPLLSLCTASTILVQGIQHIVRNYTGVDMNFYYERRGDVLYPAIACATSKAKIVLSWLYKEPVTLTLSRKYQNYKNVVPDDIV